MLNGHWHAVGSAARLEAELLVNQDQYQLIVEGRVQNSGRLDNLKVSERLGNVERRVTLDDGSVFATQDNEQIDSLFVGSGKLNRLLHRLESNLMMVLIAVVLTALSSVAFFKWGIPAISSAVAYALPHKTNELLSRHTLNFLDDYFFSESELPLARQKEISEHFNSTLLPQAIDIDQNDNAEADISEIKFTLLFRKWSIAGEPIPNALALPGGEIIVTDRFVELSESQQEIDAVMLHEIGHIAHRHSLKMIVETTLVTTVVMMVTGDSNGLADMGIGLGSVLVSTNYSRGHESDADLYAFNKMLLAGIDPNAFSRIIDRITKDADGAESDQENASKEEVDTQIVHEQSELLDYLSSHPRTADRIALAEAFALCFKQGLTECDVAPSEF